MSLPIKAGLSVRVKKDVFMGFTLMLATDGWPRGVQKARLREKWARRRWRNWAGSPIHEGRISTSM